jgi:hypothetical protein
LHRGVEHVGHFVRTKAKDVAQDQYGDLAGRQHLQRGHEGQGYRFVLFVASLRAWRHVDATRE